MGNTQMSRKHAAMRTCENLRLRPITDKISKIDINLILRDRVVHKLCTVSPRRLSAAVQMYKFKIRSLKLCGRSIFALVRTLGNRWLLHIDLHAIFARFFIKVINQ